MITKSNWGGAQRYVYDLATNLPNDEFEITVAFGGEGRLKTELEAKNIRTITIPHLGRDVSFFKDLVVFFDLYWLFRKEKADIVHVNSSKIGGIGALAATFAQVPKKVFTVHGFAFNEKRPRHEQFLIKIASWLSIFLSSKTIIISEIELAQTKNWPLIKNRLALIHNGIATPHFIEKKLAKTDIFRLIGKSENSFSEKRIIGTIAELTENKGLTFAIEAMKKLPEAIFIIIGGGEKERELKKQAEESNIEERVFFAGFVQNAASYIQAFDIFLLPSIKEGLPYVLLEAGFAGIPIIATKVGGIPELLESDKNGLLVRPKDSKDIEMGIRFLSGNEAKQKELTDGLKKTIQEKFSFEEMLLKHRNLYNQK